MTNVEQIGYASCEWVNPRNNESLWWITRPNESGVSSSGLKIISDIFPTQLHSCCSSKNYSSIVFDKNQNSLFGMDDVEDSSRIKLSAEVSNQLWPESWDLVAHKLLDDLGEMMNANLADSLFRGKILRVKDDSYLTIPRERLYSISALNIERRELAVVSHLWSLEHPERYSLDTTSFDKFNLALKQFQVLATLSPSGKVLILSDVVEFHRFCSTVKKNPIIQ